MTVPTATPTDESVTPEDTDPASTPSPVTGEEQDMSDLPEWARQSLTKANAQAAKYRTQVRELEPLAQKAKELEEAQKTEQEKLTERATKAEAQAQVAREQALKFQIAAKHGITEADFDLIGTGTPDQMEARAARIASLTAHAPQPPSNSPKPLLRPGATPTENETEDEVLYNQLYGRTSGK